MIDYTLSSSTAGLQPLQLTVYRCLMSL